MSEQLIFVKRMPDVLSTTCIYHDKPSVFGRGAD
jgi:hypothetical protein